MYVTPYQIATIQEPTGGPTPVGIYDTAQNSKSQLKASRIFLFFMSILHTYIILDLETTGLNPKEAEIIEIGAVKVKDGEIADRFQTYVRPQMGVPEEITRLTGIAFKDVRNAPRINAAIENFTTFAGGLPLIVHQGRFETRFLSEVSGLLLGYDIHSVRDLARIALPSLSDHRANTLADYFEVESQSAHKALCDAEQLAGIYSGVVEVLRETSFRAKQQILQLLQGTNSPLLNIFVDLGNEAAKSEFMSRMRGGGADDLPLSNVGGEEPRAETEDSEPLDSDMLCTLFDSGGTFDRQTEGYEVRTEQIEMVRAIADAFNNNQLLVAEAGTGVGKSMAYLTPAIHHAAQNGRRIIVSTNTKNLQEQLFFKDLPHLERTLNVPFSYVLLKGRSNYICLNRWQAALVNVETFFTEDERVGALSLVLWAEQTQTGDISENNGFDMRRYAGLWAKVCSDSGYCRSQKCRTNGQCFANTVRRAAQKAHIVVVNHSLLFSDIVSENAVLGEYEDLILDEAHNIEKIAAQYLGRELNIWHIKNFTDQLQSPGFHGTGTLPALRHWMGVADLKDNTFATFDKGIGRAVNAAEDIYLKAQTFFQDLTVFLYGKQGNRKFKYTPKERYRPGENTFDAVGESLADFAEASAELNSSLKNLCDWLKDLPDDTFPNQDELVNELDGRAQACSDLLATLNHLTHPEDEQDVYWFELPTRENSSDTRLFSAPLYVAEVLRDALYDKMRTIVFTSATLGIRGKLIYFLRRMGLDAMPDERVQTSCLGSPFDYDLQALVCVPQFMPSPKSPQFQRAVDDLLRHLAREVGRGTLALYTSYSMLNQSYDALKNDLSSEGILLLGQGIDGARGSITDRFKTHRRAMLLGTDSFWEGVDIPGEALEILGIIRLPFAVPSEPLVAAHMEELEKQGKNPFLHYSVPEAILKFRQGFGRLIRNKSDRGIVIVFDSRVLSTFYGRAFLEALPVQHRAFRAPEHLLQTIKSWFDKASVA